MVTDVIVREAGIRDQGSGVRDQAKALVELCLDISRKPQGTVFGVRKVTVPDPGF